MCLEWDLNKDGAAIKCWQKNKQGIELSIHVIGKEFLFVCTCGYLS